MTETDGAPDHEAEVDPTPVPVEQDSQEAKSWSPAKRIVFRFAFLYFVLYAWPFALQVIPGGRSLEGPISDVSDRVILWVGENVLRVPYEISVAPNGSGDTTAAYIYTLVMLFLALASCLVWTLVDKRSDYRFLGRWLTGGCRYYLAIVMFAYQPQRSPSAPPRFWRILFSECCWFPDGFRKQCHFSGRVTVRANPILESDSYVMKRVIAAA